MPSTVVTLKHQRRVAELLTVFAIDLLKRANVHDESKHSAEEKGPLDEMQRLINEEGQASYGSEEYKRCTSLLGPMLAHHYANNSHHPEHYKDGVNGMNLMDLVEMFLDWKAASERGEESSMNLTAACNRFKISDQVKTIFANTADKLGYNHQ